MALTPNISNVQPAGIADWQIKLVTDGLYRSLAYFRKGLLEIKPLATKDTRQRDIQYGYELAASGEFLAVGTASHFADLLGIIGTGNVSHKIALIGGQYVNSGATSMSPATFGTKWKMISDKDMDDSLYCQFSASRRLIPAEWGYILASNNTNPAVGTNNNDALTALAPVIGDIVPAGITQIELGASAGLGDVVSNLRNGKFTAELLTTPDTRGQEHGYAVKIDFEGEGMETTTAELTVWQAIAARANYVKLTFAGLSTFTSATSLGLTTMVSSLKDSDDIMHIKIVGSGIILPAAFTTAWS
jgi:hypothetical protein